MKLNQLSILLILCCTQWACGGSPKEQQSASNDSTITEPTSTARMRISIDPSASALSPITYAEIGTGIASLNQVQQIQIPVAYTFEKEQLDQMLHAFDASGHHAEGIMAYPIEENGYVKMALVAYYTEDVSGETVYKHFPESVTPAFNFSSMCPPQKCASNKDILGVDPNAVHYIFHK